MSWKARMLLGVIVAWVPCLMLALMVLAAIILGRFREARATWLGPLAAAAGVCQGVGLLIMPWRNEEED